MSITNSESQRPEALGLAPKSFQKPESLKKDKQDTMAATKVALITASSAGLGAQIARVFAPDFRVVS